MFLDIQTTTAKKIVDDNDEDSGETETETNNENSQESDYNSLSASEKWKKVRSGLDPKFGKTSSMTNMAEQERLNKSLGDMPYFITFKIKTSMDTDRGWETLAAEAGFTMDQIMKLKNEQNRPNGSPTEKLLQELKSQNYKIYDLYEKLDQAKRFHERNILNEYICKGGHEPKYASLSSSSRQSDSYSLQSLISQLDTSAPTPRPSISSGYSSSVGTDFNFNRQHNFGKSKGPVGGTKVYDDKVIPGAEQNSNSFFSSAKYLTLGAELPEALLHSKSTAVMPSRQKPYNSMGNGNSLPSTPTFNNPIANSTSEAPHRLIDQLINTCKRPPVQQRPSLIPCQSNSDLDAAIGVKAAFTYNEISKATENFDQSNILGQGAFGTVYYGFLRNQECAVKRLNEAPEEQSQRSDQIKKELTTFLKFQHKNIVTLYGYALDGPKVCLVYEYLKNGSLDDRLQRKNNTPSLFWERRLNILVGACQGLNFLHTMGGQPLIHGDLKSANILLDRYLEAKICDLGQANYATSSSHTHITIADSSTKLFGSKAYQAPEIMNNSSISVKSDIYAMGVVILEVCSGLSAYDQFRNENKFLAHLFKNQIRERDECEWVTQFQDKTADALLPEVFVQLLKIAYKCLKEGKKSRPDSAKLLEEIEHLYKQEYYQTETHDRSDDVFYSQSSLSSSIRANSDISTRCNLSDMTTSAAISCTPSMVSPELSTTSRNISVQLQNEKIREYSLYTNCNNENLPLPQHVPENQPGVSSPSVGESLQRSKPYHLQKYYDLHPGKRIDKISISDGSHQQNSAQPEDTTPISNSSQISLEDYFPKPDPKKMEELMKFDEGNFKSSSVMEPDSEMPLQACSKAKLQYITEFDDRAFNEKQPIHSQSVQPPVNFCPHPVPLTGNTTVQPEEVSPYDVQSASQNIPPLSPSHINPSPFKRDSGIDNNSAELLAGQFSEMDLQKNTEAISAGQSHACDGAQHAGEPSVDSMDIGNTDLNERIQKRNCIFSNYVKEIQNSEEDGGG